MMIGSPPAGRMDVPRAILGAAILGLSIPASYALGALTLVFLVTGGALLGSSLAVGGPLIRPMAALIMAGLALGLFSLFVKVIQ